MITNQHLRLLIADRQLRVRKGAEEARTASAARSGSARRRWAAEREDSNEKSLFRVLLSSRRSPESSDIFFIVDSIKSMSFAGSKTQPIFCLETFAI